MSIWNLLCAIDEILFDIFEEVCNPPPINRPRPTRKPTTVQPPDISPTPPPGPTTPPPPDPIWDGDQFLPEDCKALSTVAFYRWCSKYASNEERNPKDAGSMLCAVSNCTYDFFYPEDWKTKPYGLVYIKQCPDSPQVQRDLEMTEEQFRHFDERCQQMRPGPFPIWAIVLLVLSVLAALITIGAIFWNTRQQQKQQYLMRRGISTVPGSGTGSVVSGVSRTPTQRSSLQPTSRLATTRTGAASQPMIIGSDPSTTSSGGGGPGVVPQSSFNRLTVSKMRAGPSSRRLSSVLGTGSHSRSISRSHSRSGSSSAGRPRRLGTSTPLSSNKA